MRAQRRHAGAALAANHPIVYHLPDDRMQLEREKFQAEKYGQLKVAAIGRGFLARKMAKEHRKAANAIAAAHRRKVERDAFNLQKKAVASVGARVRAFVRETAAVQLDSSSGRKAESILSDLS